MLNPYIYEHGLLYDITSIFRFYYFILNLILLFNILILFYFSLILFLVF